MPILSISSSMKTGLFVPAVLMFWMMRPGSAPMYVRRWPRISASSWMPPRLMRTNLRPMARAMLLPSDVLPTPGGPTKARMGLRIVSASVRTAPRRGGGARAQGAAPLGPPRLDLLGHARRIDLLAQLVDLGLLRVVLAQLALDGLELLAQDVLAPGPVPLGLDLR